MEFIWTILIGMTAGWIARHFLKGKDFGVTVDIIAGMVGALIGGLLFERIGLFAVTSLVGSLLAATSGAIIFLYGLRVLKKKFSWGGCNKTLSSEKPYVTAFRACNGVRDGVSD